MVMNYLSGLPLNAIIIYGVAYALIFGAVGMLYVHVRDDYRFKRPKLTADFLPPTFFSYGHENYMILPFALVNPGIDVSVRKWSVHFVPFGGSKKRHGSVVSLPGPLRLSDGTLVASGDCYEEVVAVPTGGLPYRLLHVKLPATSRRIDLSHPGTVVVVTCTDQWERLHEFRDTFDSVNDRDAELATNFPTSGDLTLQRPAQRKESESMARTIETHAGQHIRSAIEEAVELAAATNEPVSFDFNGTTHTVEPGECYEQAKARIGTDLGFPILEAEEEAARARESLERMEREQKEAMASAGAASEAEMRDAEVPWIKTPEELSAYIAGLVDRPHDYGTCVYAMSMAAVAAFNYVSGRLGVSGFQASCADMDILRRTRRIENGFRIIPYDDLLYPQYWDAERAPIYEAVLADPESAARFAAKAQKLLDEGNAAYTVREHWQRIAALGTTGETPEMETTQAPERAGAPESEEEALAVEILFELQRARAKFPGDNVTMLALMEEVGELAKATFEESRERVRKEAIQVATMAMRVVLDGDQSLDEWRRNKGLDPLTEEVADG